MPIEVEQKHRITDEAALVARLSERGVSLGPPVLQVDRYFAHPCRDFAQTDEALRIRTVDEQSFVTYKGPKLDATTKSRREIELSLPPDDSEGARFTELLQCLGFTGVATVEKFRRSFRIENQGRDVHGALDAVGGLGTFVELELASDEAGLDAARQVIAALAIELELGPSERRSYLEMLLEAASRQKKDK